MLKIEFTTRALKIEEIRASLAHVELSEMLVLDAAHPAGKDNTINVIRGIDCSKDLVPCVRIEVFVADNLRAKVIDALRRAAIHERMISDTIEVSTLVEAVAV